jgi:hypothetical protein
MFDFARSESLRCLSPFPTIAFIWIRRAWRAKLTPAAVLAAILWLLAAGAYAQTIYTVTLVTDAQSTDSSGNPGLGPGAPGDLRYGIQQAIANGGTQIIQFSTSICNNSEPCKITLSNPLPPIENNGGLNLTIDGGTFGWVIIDGASSYRVFFVDAGTVTLRNLQIQNALAQGGAGGGGGPRAPDCLSTSPGRLFPCRIRTFLTAQRKAATAPAAVGLPAAAAAAWLTAAVAASSALAAAAAAVSSAAAAA